MSRITFNEVSINVEKSIKCSICGKRLKRQKKLFQTLNPFNTNSDGTIKSREDIYKELSTRAKVWKAEPEVCQKHKIGV